MNMSFDPVVTFRAEPYLAAFDAVLLPALGPGRPFRSAGGAALGNRVTSALRILRKKWHATVWGLHNAGAPGFADRKAAQYAANCPPFGVRTRDISMPCRRCFCPFCFGRQYVIAPFQGFARLLKRPLPDGSGLVAFRAAVPLAAGADAVPVMTLCRDTELRFLDSKAWFVHHQAVQGPDGPLLARHGIALCRPGFEPRVRILCRYGSVPGHGLRGHTFDPTPAGLRAAFRAVGGYDPWWLAAPPKQITAAAAALHGRRRYSSFGLKTAATPTADEADDGPGPDQED